MHFKRSEAFLEEIETLKEKLLNKYDLRTGVTGGEISETETTILLSDHDAARLMIILECYTSDAACIVHAADDEPIFVLRGQDRFAPFMVRHWAEMCDTAVENGAGSADTKAKAFDARACATEMENFRFRKVPD